LNARRTLIEPFANVGMSSFSSEQAKATSFEDLSSADKLDGRFQHEAEGHRYFEKNSAARAVEEGLGGRTKLKYFPRKEEPNHRRARLGICGILAGFWGSLIGLIWLLPAEFRIGTYVLTIFFSWLAAWILFAFILSRRFTKETPATRKARIAAWISEMKQLHAGKKRREK
jgi:hypothetical protein